MGFEYDSDKSAENKRKRGIDFEAAQRLWADARLPWRFLLARRMSRVGC